MNLHVFYFGVKIFYTTYSNFVDPDPNGIRIQQFCGSVYGILIRIHTIKIGEKGWICLTNWHVLNLEFSSCAIIFFSKKMFFKE